MTKRVRTGNITCEDIVTDSLTRANEFQQYNIFVELFGERSFQRAKMIDLKIKEGTAGKLAGAVIAIKDNICKKGESVTCASSILKGYVSPYSSTVVQKLEEQDAIIIGRTNMDEFAMGSSSENSVYGPVKNPINEEYVTGGSSGGSAAAVAAGITSAALGSDTGGSIRQPAAYSGVTGLKPTYGRVSRYGLVAFASSFDQIGPIGNNIDSVAALLNSIAGYDPKDSTSVNLPVPDYLNALQENRSDFKFAVPTQFITKDISPEIRDPLLKLFDKLRVDGHQVDEVDLPHAPYANSAYYVIANAEASSNLSRFDGARYGNRDMNSDDLQSLYVNSRSDGFGDEVKRRILLGTFVLSAGYYDAYYKKAQKVRRLIYNDFNNIFSNYDIILSPVSPTLPFKLGEKIDDPIAMYLNDIFTVPVNLAGLPGLVVPCSESQNGLPVGLQLIGRHFEESLLLQAGKYIEANYCDEWTKRECV